MREHRRRAQALERALSERDLDGLLVSAPANVRYLTGYTGSNGLALLRSPSGEAQQAGGRRAPGSDSERLFFTDFRYETQAAEEVDESFRRWPISPSGAAIDLFVSVARSLGVEVSDERAGRMADGRGSVGPAVRNDADQGPPGGGGSEPRRRDGDDGGRRRLGFDDEQLSVARYGRLAELVGERWELSPCAGMVEELRELKDEHELGRIEAAARLADDALQAVLEAGLAGRTERDVAIELELHMRRRGAEGPSFPSIVACGAHGALPHAQPREVAIPAGALVTIDWGALLEGYCSDCTRTYATAEPSARQREIYELVLAAQVQALAAVRPGHSGLEVNAVARELIAAAGYGERFGHGTGHGVGLEVHEGPRVSRSAGERPLRAGNVITVEPGVYLPGELGVRIEDLAVVTTSGARALSSLPKELTVVS